MLKQCLAVFIFSVLASAALAETNLLTVYQRALRHDPNFQSALERRLAVEATYPQARAAFLPTIQAQLDHTHTSRFIDYYDNESSAAAFVNVGNFRFHSKNYLVTLSEPLFNYGALKKLSETNEQVAAAISTYHAALQNLMVRVAGAYLDVLQAIDLLRFTRAEKRADYRQLEQAKHRYDVGLDAITAVYDAKASCDAVKAQEIIAENAVDNAKEKMREIMGIAVSEITPLKDHLSLKKPQPAVEADWVRSAQQYNFDLKASQHRLKAAYHNVGAKFSGHLPTLDLTGRLSANRGGTAGFGGSYQRNKIVALELNIPIFEGGLTSAQTREAHHLYQKGMADLESVERQVLSQTRRSYKDVMARIAAVAANRQAVQSAKVLANSTEEAFRVGTRTMVNVLNAQKDLYDTERALSQSEYNYIRAVLSLKQAAGLLSLRDLEEINTWFSSGKTKQTKQPELSEAIQKKVSVLPLYRKPAQKIKRKRSHVKRRSQTRMRAVHRHTKHEKKLHTIKT